MKTHQLCPGSSREWLLQECLGLSHGAWLLLGSESPSPLPTLLSGPFPYPQLLCAMVAKLGNREDPLPQDSFEGVDEDEWVSGLWALLLLHPQAALSHLPSGAHLPPSHFRFVPPGLACPPVTAGLTCHYHVLEPPGALAPLTASSPSGRCLPCPARPGPWPLGPAIQWTAFTSAFSVPGCLFSDAC